MQHTPEEKKEPDKRSNDNGDACLMFVCRCVVCKYDNNNVKAFRHLLVEVGI